MIVETVVSTETPPGPIGGTGSVIALNFRGVAKIKVPSALTLGSIVDTIDGAVKTPVPV